MNLLWFRKKDIPPPDRPDAEHDLAAMHAINRAHDSLVEGQIHLTEIEERRKRLEKIRHENHFAPQIHEAFRRKKSD